MSLNSCKENPADKKGIIPANSFNCKAS